MAREWLLRGVDPEELKSTPKEEIPQTPRSRWENFWYHHKLKFWLVVFAVAVLAVGIWQMTTRNEPDYTVLLLTNDLYTSGQIEEIQALLTPYGEDLDGDGTVEINVQNCLYGSKVDQSRNSGIQQVQAHLMAGDRMLFIWEPTAYDFFKKTVVEQADKKMDFFTTLSGDDSRLIENDKIWKKDGLYFGVREAYGSAEKAKELHEQCFDLLQKAIAGFKAED